MSSSWAATAAFGSLRSVTVMDHCLPPAWNVSWNGALDQLPMHPAIRQDENYRTDQPAARPKVSGTAMDDLRASH